MRSLRLLLLPLLMLTLALPAIGCSYQSVDKLIRYYPDHHAEAGVSGEVPRRGEYRVVIRREDGVIHDWLGVKAAMRQGERLGFANDYGTLYATAGAMRFYLGSVPPNTKYVAWATSESRLGAIDPVVRGTGTAAATIGIIVGAAVAGVGLVTLMLVLDSNDDDEDEWHSND